VASDALARRALIRASRIGNGAYEVHQQKGEVVADVDCRQLFIELQCIEGYRHSVPQTKIAQMQTAMTPPDKTGASTVGKPGGLNPQRFACLL
jgi:hypothetical protein